MKTLRLTFLTVIAAVYLVVLSSVTGISEVNLGTLENHFSNKSKSVTKTGDRGSSSPLNRSDTEIKQPDEAGEKSPKSNHSTRKPEDSPDATTGENAGPSNKNDDLWGRSILWK